MLSTAVAAACLIRLTHTDSSSISVRSRQMQAMDGKSHGRRNSQTTRHASTGSILQSYARCAMACDVQEGSRRGVARSPQRAVSNTEDPMEVQKTPMESRVTGRPRVLCAYGSESGSTKRLLNSAVKKWVAQDPDLAACEVLSGNEAVEKYQSLDAIAEKFDVLLIATCSYGCGEAPVNISMLFDLLLEEADRGADTQPLSGLQHAVLGCGSTMYETFQNCPRLHDKFLGECGSRRLAMRAELDDVDPLYKSEQPAYLRWLDEVFKALQDLPLATTPPACNWDEPQGTITSGMSVSTSVPTDNAPFVFAAAAGAFAVLASLAVYFNLLPAPIFADGLIGVALNTLRS